MFARSKTISEIYEVGDFWKKLLAFPSSVSHGPPENRAAVCFVVIIVAVDRKESLITSLCCEKAQQVITDASLLCAIWNIFLLLWIACLLFFLPPTLLANKGEPQSSIELDMHCMVQWAEH